MSVQNQVNPEDMNKNLTFGCGRFLATLKNDTKSSQSELVAIKLMFRL